MTTKLPGTQTVVQITHIPKMKKNIHLLKQLWHFSYFCLSLSYFIVTSTNSYCSSAMLYQVSQQASLSMPEKTQI